MQEKTTTYYQTIVEDVLKYIENHLGENLSVKELSEYFGISFFHFHRILRAALNEPLGRYIDRVRLDTAIKLIRYSNEPLSEIPTHIGFYDLSSFSKAFSKEFGISPQEFKNNKEIILNTHIDYRINNLGAIITDLKPKLVTLPGRRVIFINVKGKYGGNEVVNAWDELVDFIMKHKLLNWKQYFFSVYYDDPEIVDINKCSSDICFVAKKNVEPQGNISSKIIKGGKYAVFRYRGSYERLWELYDSIYRNWVLITDMKLSDSPPIERYINYSNNTKAENLLTEIYLPIE